MRSLLAALASAIACAMAPSPASASLVSLTVNLSAQDFQFLPHADGSLEVDAYPLFDPTTVAPGDTLVTEIRFTGVRARLTDISPLNQGIEAVTLSHLPFAPGFFAHAQVTVDLLETDGDLLTGPQIFSGSIPFNGSLSWQVARDLTDSEFSFGGARFTYNILSGNGPITLSGALFGFYGGNIRFETVPEPPSVVLCLAAGILAAWPSRRRRVAGAA